MPRPITAQVLQDHFTGFKTSFRAGFAGVTPIWSRIATRVPSSARTEKYSWLGAMPAIREWIGDRVVEELAAHDYSITNKRFESTVKVNADDMRDEQTGIYTPLMEEMGRGTAEFPDKLVFALLPAGRTTKCYDGQYFFDTDHPMAGGVVSNVDAGGAGPWWYLLSTRRALKPLILQDREPFDFTAMDDPKDANVWRRNEFEYGTTGRCNVGFGFWQMAYASNKPLTGDNYAAARAAMIAFKDDKGDPLGLVPDLLVHSGGNEGNARRVLINPTKENGGANEWAGTATPLLAPLLAD